MYTVIVPSVAKQLLTCMRSYIDAQKKFLIQRKWA